MDTSLTEVCMQKLFSIFSFSKIGWVIQALKNAWYSKSDAQPKLVNFYDTVLLLSKNSFPEINCVSISIAGWYEGERIRDGERGWFPVNCTVEIVNSHVRARNLRLRYRLIAASEDYADYNKTISKD